MSIHPHPSQVAGPSSKLVDGILGHHGIQWQTDESGGEQ